MPEKQWIIDDDDVSVVDTQEYDARRSLQMLRRMKRQHFKTKAEAEAHLPKHIDEVVQQRLERIQEIKLDIVRLKHRRPK